MFFTHQDTRILTTIQDFGLTEAGLPEQRSHVPVSDGRIMPFEHATSHPGKKRTVVTKYAELCTLDVYLEKVA